MELPKILIIQFRTSPVTATLERQSIMRELGGDISVSCLNALDDSHDWVTPVEILRESDGVILGGSGDFDFDGGRTPADSAQATSYQLLDKLRPLLDYIFLHNIPTLGICFGHQIIGAYAGAKVVHDEMQKKSRSHQVSMLVNRDAYGICRGVPETFCAHYGHKDSLDRVPEGSTLLMSGGAECQVSALSYTQNIFTTQFHPELTIDDIHLRVEATPGYLPDGVTVAQAFIADPHANSILKNFGKIVESHAKQLAY